MDSVTHLALGACMGEAFAGKQLGKRAMLWGAVAQSVPDIDFMGLLWMNTSSGLLAHRGFTHSLLFCILITPLFAILAERWHRPHNIHIWKWMLFFGGVVFTHIFIDTFNNYGVGWLEPFSHERISFNSIYVADPLFSAWPCIACFALFYIKNRAPQRKYWWRFGLGLSGLYLLLCIVNKIKIDTEVKTILRKQKISYTRYFTTPAPLQSWLWYVVAGNDKGYFTGYRSLFDKEKNIELRYFPRNDALLTQVHNHEEVMQLIRFSRQFYIVQKWGDTLVFNDLRFGQIRGWEKPGGKFVFHYFLQHPDDNTFVTQRGRFEGWDRQTGKSLLERIKGN